MSQLILEQYRDLARRAHDNTSFSPEKRGDQMIKDYSEELEADLLELGEKCGNYEEKYKRYFSAWLGAKSRCFSSMMTGGSNFPVRRAEKANNSEHNRSVEFSTWREKYFKAVYRVKTLSPEEELDSKLKKLDTLMILNEKVKEINKIISSGKRKKLSNEDIIHNVVSAKILPDARIIELFKHVDYYDGRCHTLGTYATKIRKAREDVLIYKGRIQRKANWEDIEFDGGYITIEDDRVKIFHDSKPEKEVIANLKSSGFRWSPNWSCWCRKHTGNAVAAAKKLVGMI
jgi:hypothetical protein